jgi:hypothetical protein
VTAAMIESQMTVTIGPTKAPDILPRNLTTIVDPKIRPLQIPANP